jgi:hypothetical protein
MKTFTKGIFFLMLLACMALSLPLNAANSVQTVEQVSSSVDITDDVDYVITSATPFATAGSVNIVNKEHAVVRLSAVKPSSVISNWLNHVYIDGEAAQNNVNCQVKMYNNGAIIFPYDRNFRPLTCYTEQNFSGESCDNYTEGNSGGFMKTLTGALLNNQIRSFKLKRGYMVTFAIGTAGWGYSRCFIADNEDLEISTLPAVLDQRISSYRLFKWQNFGKAGLANDTRYDPCNKLNVTGCYSFGNGENRYPDTECIPHHIYEDWPSASSCGSATYSCHMKTNNEPGNSADDHPQDVATVLANWENLMRTGMRLCSESSHDGSMGHLKEFIDSIDARGWRCDILDLHCYWSGGFDSGNMNWYSSNYGKGRPIWISEWIWGASWNRNGCFSDGRTEQEIINNTKSILNSLNGNPRVERYFYWNSESKGHIYEGGKLTTLGQEYSKMDTGLGYTKDNEFIPRNPPCQDLGQLQVKYTASKGTVRLSWEDPNGDLMSTINIQRQSPGQVLFKTLKSVTPKDKSSRMGAEYVFTDTVTEPGSYKYKISAKWGLKQDEYRYTNEVLVDVAPAQGTSSFQHGRLNINTPDETTTLFSEEFPESPKLFVGTMTDKNSLFYASNYLKSATMSQFTYKPQQWKNSKGSLSKTEELPFMALLAGNYTFKGHNGQDLQCEVGEVKSGKSAGGTSSEVTEVTFNEPFPEGVIPVVLTEIRTPIYTTTGFGVKVFDVTNTGFKFIVYTEESTGVKPTAKNVEYFAITPGVGAIDLDNEIYIAAGHGSDSKIYGSSDRLNKFYFDSYDAENDSVIHEQLYLLKPTILTSLQTNNFPALCMLRRYDATEKDDNRVSWTTGTNVYRVLDRNLTVDGKTINSSTTLEEYRDELGWVCISGQILFGENRDPINIEVEETLQGDVNGDGKVDISDVVAVINTMAGDETFKDTADVNGDEVTDISDVVMIINIMAGVGNSEEAEE